MNSLAVSRMSAAENTFFLVNGFEDAWKQNLAAWDLNRKIEFTRWMCNHYFGFHTDGLLYLLPEPGFDFRWEFFNSDGSHADMCGNAARCAVLFFHQRLEQKSKITFISGAGPVGGSVISSNEVRVEMPPVLDLQPMRVLGVQGLYARTGVPHFVIEKEPDSSLARKLRQVTDFGTEGANITFIQNLADNALDAVTYERGVENFTQACGTGAVAAACAFQKIRGDRKFVTVRMPGGELKIEGGQVNQRPYLTGPAQFEFELSRWSTDEKF